MIAVVVGLLIGTAPYLLGRRPGRVLAGTNTPSRSRASCSRFFAVIFGVGAKGRSWRSGSPAR